MSQDNHLTGVRILDYFVKQRLRGGSGENVRKQKATDLANVS